MFWKCQMFSFEGWKILLFGGLGINKLHFFIKKIWFFFRCKFFLNFRSWKPWIQIGIQPEMLDPDPDHTLFCSSLKLASVRAPDSWAAAGSRKMLNHLCRLFIFFIHHSYLRLLKTISSVFFYIHNGSKCFVYRYLVQYFDAFRFLMFADSTVYISDMGQGKIFTVNLRTR
jgi:hypothetical protein